MGQSGLRLARGPQRLALQTMIWNILIVTAIAAFTVTGRWLLPILSASMSM